MDENEIRQVMRRNPVLRPHFDEVLSIDEARPPSKRPAAIIYNTDPSYKPGKHWIAIFSTASGENLFFDSYAQPIPDQIRGVYSRIRPWPTPCQSLFSTVCGEYCIYFCYLCARGLSWLQINIEMATIDDREVKNIVNNI